jgi:hypothetical protein
MVRRGKRETIPTPNQAPAAEARIIALNVAKSTLTIAMKITASAVLGKAWPAFNVPGTSSSGIRRSSLKIVVVGAKEPIPSVSKKSVAKPIIMSALPARRLDVPDRAPRARSTIYQR